MPYCSNCGEMVTPTFARVFGDNEGTIDGCVHCHSSRELTGLAEDETPTVVELAHPRARP